jgi:hypothetical protein
MYQPQPAIVRALVTDRMQQVRADLSWTRARRADRQHERLRRKERRRPEVPRVQITPVIDRR